MSRRSIVIIIFIMLYSIILWASENATLTKTVIVDIHPDLPTMRCVHVWNETKTDYHIDLFWGEQHVAFQTLRPFIGNAGPSEHDEFFWGEDVNFDQYHDLKLFIGSGVTGDRSFAYWTFNPTTHTFEYAEEFEELCNPEVVPTRHHIATHCNMGAAGHEYRDAIYGYEEGILVKLREERQTYHWQDDRQWFVNEVMIRHEGKMVLVTRKTIPINTDF